MVDDFKSRVPSEDQKKFWFVIGGPKDILKAKEVLKGKLSRVKDDFFKEMNQEQVKYEFDVENIENDMEEFFQNSETKNYSSIFAEAQELNETMKSLLAKANLFNQRELLFEKKSSDYQKVYDLEKTYEPLYSLWEIVNTWKEEKNGWIRGDWARLDARYAEEFVGESIKTLNRVINNLKERGKKYFIPLIHNTETILKGLETFNTKIPLLVALKTKGMFKRHWAEISAKLGKTIHPKCAPGFSFQYCLDEGLLDISGFCLEVGKKASREYRIELGLKEMYAKWGQLRLETVQFKKTDYSLVKGFVEIDEILDNDFSLTNGMIVNPFRGPFEKEINAWNDKLLLISNVIEEWRVFQKQWAYLQPIFSSPDISRQLINESNMFKKIDMYYKTLLNQVKDLRHVLKIMQQERLYEKIRENNAELEQIQNELNSYLQLKRGKFARFYFLSNDQLLSILSETKEVEKIQPHLRKIFENISLLNFTPQKAIDHMISVEGERIRLSKPVNPLGKQVEDWMNEVELQMRRSVKRCLFAAIADYHQQPRTQWVFKHPGQCVLNGNQLQWTNRVEQAIKTKTVEQCLAAQKAELLDIIKIERGSYSKLAAITVEALIIVDVHAIDVVEKLIKERVKDITAFEWISQLRYYDKNGDCYVDCLQTSFPYGYEYLGNTSRLVITPLTDKCYMTLMGALKLNLGGAPAGPAGTGKTETTKDLAKALAMQCVVFNCQESMGYEFVAKFFKGLASSGAWCCFDEFNRINIEVLSVIAQQLQQLFSAKAQGLAEIRFEDTMIRVRPTFSVYITMNPGYAGRSELPENLKALFRPVAMMIPNYALIAEIKLYAFGFTQAKILSKKMIATFKLASESLSSQKHYDYGMRAVCSVINAAGLFKRSNANSALSEYQLLLKALRDVNIPKFLSQDIPLFENIIKDLFPDTEPDSTNDPALLDAIKTVCSQRNLVFNQYFLEKILQFKDTLNVRHGLMLVGETGGGKTSCYSVLRGAMDVMKGSLAVKLDVVNPKAVPLDELYGKSVDLNWSQGIIEKIFEKTIADEDDCYKWILFDGPVDAVWIESMNTVLDDNKKLCLSSGKVLLLNPLMRILFEVNDLQEASPATVSRCGMVYMEPRSLDLKHLVTSHLRSFPPIFREKTGLIDTLRTLIAHYFFPSLAYVRTSCALVFQIPDITILEGFLKLLGVLLKGLLANQTSDGVDLLLEQCEDIVVFVTVWAVGALCD